MRKIIKILIKYEIPSFFLTKSTLIRRDIDLIGELNDRAYASVNVSVSLTDEKIRKIFEPYSSSSKKRFETLELFRNQNIHGGVSMMPILPFIGDSDDNLDNLYSMANNYKAEFALISSLTLKPGNREQFFTVLAKNYPGLLNKYKLIFPEGNTFGIPKIIPSLKNVTKIGHNLSKKYKLKPRIPRYIPEGCIENNYKLVELLEYYLYYETYITNKLDYNTTKEIKNAICIISELSFDILNLDEDELQMNLNITSNVSSIISVQLNKMKSKKG